MVSFLPKYQNLKCKICNSETSVFGIKDFNGACNDTADKKTFPACGHAIYYHQCKNCHFIFTIDFDNWSKDDFLENIYNKEYIQVDPEYAIIRPRNSANYFVSLVNHNKSISVLDFGAGSNEFSKELKARGYNAIGWDVMWGTEIPFKYGTTFDFVTAHEVMEHTPTPWETTEQIVSFLKPNSGKIVFTTQIVDEINGQGINFPYIAPRNGHVSIHSHKSLEIMFNKFGLKVEYRGYSLHIASWKQ